MDTRNFCIEFDPSRDLLQVTMRGHWTLETVAIYRRALGQAIKQMVAAGGRTGEILALVDAREIGAQSQEVIASYKDSLGGQEFAAKRLATLLSSALFKRQVERIGIPNQRLFTDTNEALAWLTSTDDRG